MTETRAPIEVNAENNWRLQSPGAKDWLREVRPGKDKKKYFIISSDAHINPPSNLFRERLDKKWHDLLPRMEIRNGSRYLIVEGVEDTRLVDSDLSGEDFVRSKSGAQLGKEQGNYGISAGRIADQELDGVDGEVIFPNGAALFMWASKQVEFVKAQCQVWNDWVAEVCSPYYRFCNPAAVLFPTDIAASVKEVERISKLGFRFVMLPCRPVFGPSDVHDANYNLPEFDPLWAAIQDHNLAITYHVGTSRDPRGARGNGGAIINYVVHALAPTIEPIVSMCTSGVFDRFPRLRAATIEANAGWVPWMLQAMDEAYRKHHMWVRPKLKSLPSEQYRANCFSSFGEDQAAIELCEKYHLEDNLMWGNDYPHHEGSWPHSAEAIERSLNTTMSEEKRAKLLGLNAAKVFRFDIPKEYMS
jgi:predicted TIM-barrel fold metal-dependent hydrolase